MSDIALRIAAYYELRPTQYPVVVSLALSQGLDKAGVCEQRLSLLMQREFGHAGPYLHLEFRGVRKLVMNQTELSLMSISHIQIRAGCDVPNVHSNFLVCDPEQERVICFECRDFVSYIE